MTRTDVMASSRPRTASAAPKGKRSVLRGLAVLPIILMLALALMAPGTAVAAESTTSSGYNQEPKKPTTGTSPSTETTTPSKETTPAKETAPTSTTPASEPAAKTLPFTGFDLRWSFGIGLLLMGAGFSIVVIQRRQRRTGGR